MYIFNGYMSVTVMEVSLRIYKFYIDLLMYIF